MRANPKNSCDQKYTLLINMLAAAVSGFSVSTANGSVKIRSIAPTHKFNPLQRVKITCRNVLFGFKKGGTI